MKKIRVAIIDDEQHSISILTDHILNMPALELVHTFSNPMDALNGIRNSDRIDLLFLDVSMPDMSGIELAGILKDRVRFIIFTTGYSKYAIKAFELDVRQYLLKPIERVQFTRVISSILNKEVWLSHEKDGSVFIHVKGKEKVTRVKTEEIIYFETAGNYLRLVTDENDFLTYLTMKEIEAKFDAPNFHRTHRRFIVNMDKIEDVTGNNIHLGGHHFVLMSAGYRQHVRRYIAEKTLRTGRPT